MKASVEILGEGELPAVPCDGEAFARTRARYTRMLIERGCGRLVDNAPVDVRALVVGEHVWPLVLSNPGARAAGVCSPLTWYARSATAGTLPMRALMAFGDADRVVYVNNWIAAASPPARLDAEAIGPITERLAHEWPERAIVVRAVVPAIDGRGADALASHGYRFVRSRQVEVIDGSDPAVPRRSNVRYDLAALAKTSYEIVEEPERLLPHCNRFAELYRSIYLEKYLTHNPERNARWFEHTIADGILRYRALFRGGRPDGIVHALECGSTMVTFLVGYDRDAEPSLAPYRILIATLIQRAIEGGLELNLGSGVDRFKRLRGARAVDEFDAVYDAHLTPRRRLPWAALRALSNRRALGGVPS